MHFRRLKSSGFVPLLLAVMFAATACSKENEVDQSSTATAGSCTEKPETLALLCPSGTAFEISNSAGQNVCPDGTGEVKDGSGNTSAVCKTFAGCSVRCKVLSVCGNGTCEGDERATCDGQGQGCVPCAKDCGGPVCGDKICNGEESPQSCPQDCAGTCTPGEPLCVGSKVLLCGPNNQPTTELIDCATNDQICGNGKCQAKNVCGNGVCDGEENPQLCPQDCQTGCQPGTTTCKDATTLLTCSADGKSKAESPCPQGKVCNGIAGKCDAAEVCGNGVCEQGEGEGDTKPCPQDCKAAVCGDGQCNVGESPISCPQDCNPGVCGNGKCEQDEQKLCPQDCPQLICTPTDRQCLSLNVLQVCNAAGTELTSIDCSQSGQVCGSGQCVAAGACGNGACEAPKEDITSCPQDCTAACGNGTCDKPYENALKCAKDCPAECGDGFCTGTETPVVCELDCPVNCGNGVCDLNETRKNCTADCGFCGDEICQPEETPSLNPPPDKESCAIDCVKINCTSDADCDDLIDCTADKCGPGGKCTYAADNALCGSGATCLGAASSSVPGSGCCADKDGDGFPAQNCGGNDCFDEPADSTGGKYGALSPSQVYPTAVGEQCDGIDRNCNGTNQPKVTASNDSTLPLTPDSSDSKPSFEVAMEPGIDGKAKSYLLAWRAVTENGPVFQYALADAEGLIDGAVGVRTVTDVPFELAGVVYSPARSQYALAWTVCNSGRDFGKMSWISPSGPLKGELQDALDVGHLHFNCENNGGPSPAYFARAQEPGGEARYTLFQSASNVYNNKCGAWYPDASGWPALISEQGGVTFLDEGPGMGCNGGGSIIPKAFVNRRTRFIFFYQGYWSPFGYQEWFPNAYSWKPTGSPSSTKMPGYNWKENVPVMTFDGTAIVGVTADPSGDGLRYQRIDPVSYGPLDKPTEETPPGQLIDAAMKPRVVTTDAKDSIVGIFGLDADQNAQNLSALLRKQSDGSKLTSPSIMAKGDDIRSVKVLWDGTSFRAFYASKIKGRHQLYTAPMRCD